MSEKENRERETGEIGNEVEIKQTDYDYETYRKMAAWPDPEKLYGPAIEKGIQIMQRGIDPIIKDNEEKRKRLQKREKEIKRLRPHAEGNKKALKSLKEGRKTIEERNQVYRTLWPLYQAEAEKIWSKHPGHSNIQVGRILSKKINALIDPDEKGMEDNSKLEEKNSLNEAARLLYEISCRVKPGTIRRRIHKP